LCKLSLLKHTIRNFQLRILRKIIHGAPFGKLSEMRRGLTQGTLNLNNNSADGNPEPSLVKDHPDYYREVTKKVQRLEGEEIKQ
jgi:hypothetical protein